MWPFDKPKPAVNQPSRSTAMLDLEERMNKVERVVRDIETDWAATYDKFHRLNMRIAKRAKVEEKEPENGSEATEAATRIRNPLAEQLLRRGHLR